MDRASPSFCCCDKTLTISNWRGKSLFGLYSSNTSIIEDQVGAEQEPWRKVSYCLSLHTFSSFHFYITQVLFLRGNITHSGLNPTASIICQENAWGQSDGISSSVAVPLSRWHSLCWVNKTQTAQGYSRILSHIFTSNWLWNPERHS